MYKLLVDFNDSERGSVSGLNSQSDAPAGDSLRAHDTVLLYDAEGNSCLGRVTRVQGEMITVAIDRESAARRPEIAAHGWWKLLAGASAAPWERRQLEPVEVEAQGGVPLAQPENKAA
jgi:hypothetical protein